MRPPSWCTSTFERRALSVKADIPQPHVCPSAVRSRKNGELDALLAVSVFAIAAPEANEIRTGRHAATREPQPEDAPFRPALQWNGRLSPLSPLFKLN